jgi:predicted nucleotidyltransferase
MEKALETLLHDLKQKVEAVLEDVEAEFILYGSRARGDFDHDSDIDVAIIVPGLTRELKDRILEVVAEVEFEYSRAISTLVFSKREFDRLVERERRIAVDIRYEGIAL